MNGIAIYVPFGDFSNFDLTINNPSRNIILSRDEIKVDVMIRNKYIDSLFAGLEINKSQNQNYSLNCISTDSSETNENYCNNLNHPIILREKETTDFIFSIKTRNVTMKTEEIICFSIINQEHEMDKKQECFNFTISPE